MTERFGNIKKPIDELEREEDERNGIVREVRDNLIYLDENNPPLFISMVLNNRHLGNEAKMQFKEKFLKKFLKPENIEFRKSVRNSTLFFYNNRYRGLVNDIRDTFSLGTEKDDRYFIDIYN